MSDDRSRRSTSRQYSDALPDDFDAGIANEPWPGRLPSSSRRYDRSVVPSSNRSIITMHPNKPVPRSAIPPRRSALPSAGGRPTREAVPEARRRRGFFRAHPLLWLGVGMLLMFLLWVGLQDLGAWWSVHQDDVTYGRPRTAQYDVVVGHHDSPAHPTHLIALNLHGTIEIIELPGGDSTHAHIYQGPHLFGPDADLVPVTLSFPDPSRDGHPDMDVHVQGQVIVYLNQKVQFVLQGPTQ
ncbi:MAG TPA: hypothetical protein VIZ18_14070 [Ktedonobacteraceae bacterium]